MTNPNLSRRTLLQAGGAAGLAAAMGLAGPVEPGHCVPAGKHGAGKGHRDP